MVTFMVVSMDTVNKQRLHRPGLGFFWLICLSYSTVRSVTYMLTAGFWKSVLWINMGRKIDRAGKVWNVKEHISPKMQRNLWTYQHVGISGRSLKLSSSFIVPRRGQYNPWGNQSSFCFMGCITACQAINTWFPTHTGYWNWCCALRERDWIPVLFCPADVTR